MKIKKDAEVFWSSDNIWYCLTDGGYLNPDDYLEDEEELSKVWDAIETVQAFIKALEDAELIGEM